MIFDKTRILNQVRQDLESNADDAFKKSNQRFFKEKITCYGIRTLIVRRIAKRYFEQIKQLDKKQIFVLSQELLKSGYSEEATIAIQWVSGLADRFELVDFATFATWLNKYIDNWGKTDDFCLHIIQPMMVKYPQVIADVKSWAHSGNMWLRRASAVSFITTAKGFYVTKHDLNDIFEVAQILLQDKEDLVQKAYGWMLKAASVNHQQEVFEFVIKHKDKIPRTALRYAIEKMPANLRRQAMA